MPCFSDFIEASRGKKNECLYRICPFLFSLSISTKTTLNYVRHHGAEINRVANLARGTRRKILGAPASGQGRLQARGVSEPASLRAVGAA